VGDHDASGRLSSLRDELAVRRFHVPVWLRDPHAQTCWSPIFRRRPRLRFRLERLDTPDGDFLRLHRLDGEPGAPVVILLHGLEGCVESHYVLGQAAAFARRGWSVVAMEHRSCGGELNRARRLYHSGETSDLDFLVRRLRAERGGEPELLVSGVSLGGNVLAKWLGELGDEAAELVHAAAAISPPYDLTVSGPALDRALGGFYTRRFLRKLIPKAVAKERQYPGCFDLAAVRRSRTFADFDTHATAALHGFRDAGDYWARVGCGQFLEGVRVPLLLVSAADDPFNPGSTLPHRQVATNPWLVPAFSERGGHVGFVYGAPWRTRHWAEEQVERFFAALAEAQL
jgi:predicted alpha/beta-fold hydrolase